jgi:hypothetical protein
MPFMTLTLIFLGWFILSSLWGFLPMVEPLRLFATSGPKRRSTLASFSGLLALLTGIIFLVWVGSYSAVVIMTYDAHSTSQPAQSQSTVNVVAVTNELTLRQLLRGTTCLSKDETVCAVAGQALQLGNIASMLPVISLASLIPALMAAFLCWKLTPAPNRLTTS